jgi:DNA-binding MarR family transcriptional regulator
MHNMVALETSFRNGDFAGSAVNRDIATLASTSPVVVDRQPIETIRNTMLALVRQDGRDLTARQLTALLSVYLRDEIQTVTSLANMLNVSRPGVTRILDRLVEAELVSRAEDKQDRRRVLICRTSEGARYVQTLAEVAARAGKELQ